MSGNRKRLKTAWLAQRNDLWRHAARFRPSGDVADVTECGLPTAGMLKARDQSKCAACQIALKRNFR